VSIPIIVGSKDNKTTKRRKPRPVAARGLFGQQELLLCAAQAGGVQVTDRYRRPAVRAGLCVGVGSNRMALNGDHPAFPEIKAVLQDLLGGPIALPATGTTEFNSDRPLGHPSFVPFRMLLAVAQASEPIDGGNLYKRLPDLTYPTVRHATALLVKQGALVQRDDGRYQFPDVVAGSFRRLLLRLAEISNDPVFKARRVIGGRTAAFQRDPDGLPMLFATDLATRNLIALAHYGPMYLPDLRRITGGTKVDESDEMAPYTRANVVRIWEAERGPAIMLDPAFPASRPLRQLLLRMAEAYPPAPEVRLGGDPGLPQPHKWVGDIYRLFGSPIRTRTLLTLGAYGWTFERLCRPLTGLHRENVKHVIRKLEEGEILAGDRPRGPGFDVRAIRISGAFPAKPELEAFLAEAARHVKMEKDVRKQMQLLLDKTKVHLLNRGLWPDDLPRPAAKSHTTILTRKNLTPAAAIAISETIRSQKAARKKYNRRKKA